MAILNIKKKFDKKCISNLNKYKIISDKEYGNIKPINELYIKASIRDFFNILLLIDVIFFLKSNQLVKNMKKIIKYCIIVCLEF